MATNAGGLAALLAKKAQSSGQESTASASDQGQPESIPAEPKAGEGQAERPKNPFASRKDSGSQDSSGATGVGPDAAGGNDSVDQQPRSGLTSLSLKPAAQPASGDTSGVASSTIESLDDLDSTEDEGVQPRQSMSHFSDETPATKPTRELPEGITKETLGFIDLIDGVYDVMDDAELLGGAIRNIIIELKSHPEYMKLVAPDDIRTWVRGMRESMGLAKIRKTETKAKRAGGAGRKSKLVDEDMLADLADLGVDIPS